MRCCRGYIRAASCVCVWLCVCVRVNECVVRECKHVNVNICGACRRLTMMLLNGRERRHRCESSTQCKAICLCLCMWTWYACVRMWIVWALTLILTYFIHYTEYIYMLFCMMANVKTACSTFVLSYTVYCYSVFEFSLSLPISYKSFSNENVCLCECVCVCEQEKRVTDDRWPTNGPTTTTIPHVYTRKMCKPKWDRRFACDKEERSSCNFGRAIRIAMSRWNGFFHSSLDENAHGTHVFSMIRIFANAVEHFHRRKWNRRENVNMQTFVNPIPE